MTQQRPRLHRSSRCLRVYYAWTRSNHLLTSPFYTLIQVISCRSRKPVHCTMASSKIDLIDMLEKSSNEPDAVLVCPYNQIHVTFMNTRVCIRPVEKYRVSYTKLYTTHALRSPLLLIPSYRFRRWLRCQMRLIRRMFTKCSLWSNSSLES